MGKSSGKRGLLNNSIYALALLLLTVIFVGFTANEITAKDSVYKYYDLMDAKAVAKSGKYYFKYSETDRTVYLSKKKKSSYQATPIAYEFCSNGEQAYYVKQDVENRMDTICKYVFRSGKETQIAELESVKVDDSDGWRLFAVCGDNIYLREDVGGGASEAYMYDLKRKKLSVAQKDFCIGDLYGNYVVAESKYHQDTAAYPITLYKITSSGMKEIKKITEYGCVLVSGSLVRNFIMQVIQITI